MTNALRPNPIIPEDFPRDFGGGSVAGAQPKLLVRKVVGVYVSGLTEDERYARYDNCCDIVNQLENYCHRKLGQRPDWSVAEVLEKVRLAIESKPEWDLSADEVEWMMSKLTLRMDLPAPDSPPESSE
ncbi:MAG: hypothetical protein CVU22_02540 [Betaproteobacteria bacterium HGW-Betaproteobacteria-16]|nr:MAG: hypothetical protein CVU22_02540 [Betaproteobacteria bacterium HGW-Betaproteobacteria-16]